MKLGINYKKTFRSTVEYIFYGIALLQMGCGVIWALGQLGGMQNWQSTYEYMDIAQSLVTDEYVGLLYPLFLKPLMGLEALLGIPFSIPVYVMQLVAALFANRYFAQNVLQLSEAGAWWTAGYLLSFPMLLQFHMSVRPESFVASGVFVLLGLLKKRKQSEAHRCVCLAGGMTVLLIWLMPDMAWILLSVWIFSLVGYFFGKEKNGKQLGIRAMALVLALLLGIGGNVFVQEPGSRGRIQKTFWAAAFQRVVTDYFSRSFAMWDDRVKETFTLEEAMEYAKRSDNMMYFVGPILEEKWGKEIANDFYRQMTTDCFRVRTRTVVYQIRDDLVDSALMPFSTLWQDEGGRRSQTGQNYKLFREGSGRIAGFYWKFSLNALLVLCVVKLLLNLLFGKKAWNRGSGLLWITALLQTVFVVLQSGNAVNYGNLLLMISAWCVFAVPISGEKIHDIYLENPVKNE